jgi:ribosomal protein L34
MSPAAGNDHRTFFTIHYKCLARTGWNPATAAMMSRIASCIAAGARDWWKKSESTVQIRVKDSRNRPSPFRPRNRSRNGRELFKSARTRPGHGLIIMTCVGFFFEKWRE